MAKNTPDTRHHWRITDIVPDRCLSGRFALRRADRLAGEILPLYHQLNEIAHTTLSGVRELRLLTREIAERHDTGGARITISEATEMLAMSNRDVTNVGEMVEFTRKIAEDPRTARIDKLARRGKKGKMVGQSPN